MTNVDTIFLDLSRREYKLPVAYSCTSRVYDRLCVDIQWRSVPAAHQCFSQNREWPTQWLFLLFSVSPFPLVVGVVSPPTSRDNYVRDTPFLETCGRNCKMSYVRSLPNGRTRAICYFAMIERNAQFRVAASDSNFWNWYLTRKYISGRICFRIQTYRSIRDLFESSARVLFLSTAFSVHNGKHRNVGRSGRCC